jgi:hypothetical protein
MRVSNVVPGFVLIGLAALLLSVAGCSDSKTSSSGKIAGSPNDPEFLMVQEQINDYLDIMDDDLAAGMENVYQLPTDTEEVRNMYAAMGSNDTAQYFYGDGWHVIYIARHNDYFSDFFRDSVQFRSGTEPVEEPINIDYLHFIRHWGYASHLTDVTHTNKAGYTNLVFEGLDGSAVTVNGAKDYLVDRHYISDDTTIDAQLSMDVDINDVVVLPVPTYGWVSGCPSEGTMTMALDLAYEFHGGQTTITNERSWSVLITFENGTAGVRVSSGNMVWGYTHNICNTPGN